MTFIADGDYIYQKMEEVGADGTVSVYESNQRWNGQEQPNKRGLFGATTVSQRRIDYYTSETLYRKDGKVLVASRGVISPDGKTRTARATGVDSAGRKIENILVFEKQSH